MSPPMQWTVEHDPNGGYDAMGCAWIVRPPERFAFQSFVIECEHGHDKASTLAAFVTRACNAHEELLAAAIAKAEGKP